MQEVIKANKEARKMWETPGRHRYTQANKAAKKVLAQPRRGQLTS